jgi:hypothetical protein
LRYEVHGDVLPMSAPKPVPGMYAGKPAQFAAAGHGVKDVPAKPIV